MSRGKKKMLTSYSEVQRFEENLADHALFIYCCDRCGLMWGRYITECMSSCPKCGAMPDTHVTVVEPETMIRKLLNGGVDAEGRANLSTLAGG